MGVEIQRKSVMITGAGSGLGRAIAKKFAEKGCNVAVCDINEKNGKKVVGEIEREYPVKAIFIKVDVTRFQDAENAVREAIAQFHRLDFAVNNAGIGSHGMKTGEYPIDGWDRIIAINLSGVFYGMRHQIPAILKSGGGAIVNISSVLGTTANTDGTVAYTAAKHGVIGLTKTAGLDYAQENLRINSIGPGYLNTPLLDKYDKAKKKEISSHHPMNRLGNPEEIANLVYWLCSSEASFVTASHFPIDGGYTAW